MGYSTVYWQATEKKKKPYGILMIGVGVLLTAALMLSPLGKKCVYWMLPGDGETTALALESFAEDLKAGEAFSDAAEAFCLKILEDE